MQIGTEHKHKRHERSLASLLWLLRFGKGLACWRVMHLERLRALCLMLLLSLLNAGAAPVPDDGLTIHPSTNRVAAFEKIEFRIDVPRAGSDPFDPARADLEIEVRQPGGRVVRVPAFWMQGYEHRRIEDSGRLQDWFYPTGQPGWRARLAPVLAGRHEVLARFSERSGGLASPPVSFDCVSSTNRGYVRVSAKDPRFFEFSNGEPFFPIGQNLAFIGNQQYASLSKAQEIFPKLEKYGGNYLRVWACCEDWAMAIEARKSAWGRSWDWHPAIVEAPAAARGRKAVRLGRGILRADPSHPVALRPGTKYQITGKAWAAREAPFTVAAGRYQSAQRLAAVTKWAEFKNAFSTGDSDYWLGTIELSTESDEPVFLQDLSLKEEHGGAELLWEAEVNRPVLGFYNPVDCFMLDELVSAAEDHGIYLQLCLLTRDLYMERLKAPGPAYSQAIEDAKKTFRYAVARWGYSTGIAAWEYWNEMNPGLPTDRFYSELGSFLESIDVNRHLRTTSTWGPSARDCRHPGLDVADVHFYLRPADAGRIEDEVDAILNRTAWLREQAPARPAHIGEFGLADDKWALLPRMRQSPVLADVHNATWASALSGASGTAMFWWWERLDQRDVYPVYGAVSRFVQGIPWTSGNLTNAVLTTSNPRLRAIGLRAGDAAWAWFHNRDSVWSRLEAGTKPSPIEGARTELFGFRDGRYRVEWWDTREGKVTGGTDAAARGGVIDLTLPRFESDLACKVIP